MARKKAVVSADDSVLADVERLVGQGTYGSVSAFVREAMSEKLARLRRAQLAEQVARYCRDPESGESEDLISGQAFPDDEDR
jgi:Arc/MetJ-type ribon-helix-helix transcriptional regulator